MLHMPPVRFYMANVLSAIVWAPALVLSGDLLPRFLGAESLARKIFYVTVIAATLVLLAPFCATTIPDEIATWPRVGRLACVLNLTMLIGSSTGEPGNRQRCLGV
jgi:hypothetical protein